MGKSIRKAPADSAKPAHGAARGGAPIPRAASPTVAAGRDGPVLSHERIVAAAAALVDADGLDGLSARKLGRALGCEAMSIYHHFPSKRHLLDALVDAAIAGVAPPPPSLAPRERLRHQAFAYRAMAHRHPRLFPLIAVHRLNTPTGVRLLERMLAIIAEIVPEPETATRYFRALGYYVTGAALDETTGYARGPSAAVPVPDELIARDCPHLAAAAPYARQEHWDRTFALGLDALLARLPADAAGASAPPKPVIRPKR